MFLNDLLGDIHHEILSWLEFDSQRMFAMVNRTICKQFIKHVRVLWFWGEILNFEPKLRSYLTSEKGQHLIDDPYNQLTIIVPNDLDLKAAGFDDISISCKSLTITVNQLTKFMHCVKKVQNFTVGFYGFGRRSLADSEFQSIADWINNSDLGLKQLAINNYNITQFPVISRLESLWLTNTNIPSLNISTFSNLRSLHLHSTKIEDVSSLDRVHQLHLELCGEIRDISCLNHNDTIVIKDCYRITDYSNCFRYSKIIEITCPSKCMEEPIKSCDFSKALEARKIYFDGRDCNPLLLLPHCSSLRFVQIKNLKGPLTLPADHHIREIIVRDCPNIPSLLNFDRIYSVQLFDLDIPTLEGLGSGNRVVEVNTCPLITDFSMLKHCDKVTIRNFKGFKEEDQVRGVKDLIFSPEYVDMLPNDMEGVTCLILDKVPFNLLSLKLPSSLKKVVFRQANIYLIKQLPLLMAKLPHVGKIEVAVEEKAFRPFLENGEVSFPDFIMESKRDLTLFLRRLV